MWVWLVCGKPLGQSSQFLLQVDLCDACSCGDACAHYVFDGSCGGHGAYLRIFSKGKQEHE